MPQFPVRRLEFLQCCAPVEGNFDEASLLNPAAVSTDTLQPHSLVFGASGRRFWTAHLDGASGRRGIGLGRDHKTGECEADQVGSGVGTHGGLQATGCEYRPEH